MNSDSLSTGNDNQLIFCTFLTCLFIYLPYPLLFILYFIKRVGIGKENIVREAEKKFFLLVARQLRRGGGAPKKTFLEGREKKSDNKMWPLSLRGWKGG